MISYGMGERSIVEIADALAAGIAVRDITFIKGTVYKTKDTSGVYQGIVLPSYEDMKEEKALYAKSFLTQYENTDFCTGKPLIELTPTASMWCRIRPAAPYHRGNGQRLRSPLYADLSSLLPAPWRRSGHSGDKVFPDQQPGLLWRLQLLRPYLPSGADHSGKKP